VKPEAYNKNRIRRGLFTERQIANLVRVAQRQAGLDVDGKFGTDTGNWLAEQRFDALSIPFTEVLEDLHDEGSKAFPTPNAVVWDGWVYPVPELRSGLTPDVSSGFAQYGKGPNKFDRPNHWGVDVMFRRHMNDGGPPVRQDRHGRWWGPKEAGTHSKFWYCPNSVDILCVGPGTVSRVNYGANNNVLIDHHNVPGFGPLATWYQHMHEIFVEEGDQLEAGEVIGTIGKGSSDLNHLHFEWRDHNRGSGRAASVTNPEPYINLFEKRKA